MNKNFKDILELIRENPNLPVIPMVSADCVQGDHFNYWKASFGTANIETYLIKGERIYFYDDDFDELVDDWIDGHSEAYSDDLATEAVEDYNWKRAIFVYIEP